MPIEFSSRVIIVHNQQAYSSGLLTNVLEFLEARSVLFDVISMEIFKDISLVKRSYGCALILGGDGTILRASLLLEPLRVPIIAIYSGTLGFLAEHEKNSWHDIIDNFIHHKLSIIERNLLALEVYNRGVFYRRWLAMNEVGVVSSLRKLAKVSFSISGSDDVFLRAEGITIATPLGSTGYALSLGGPIIAPQTAVLLLNAVAPFDLSARSLVVSELESITFQVGEGEALTLLIDGQVISLDCNNLWNFRVHLAQEKILWVTDHRAHNQFFYRALRDKLGWLTLFPGAK